MKPKGLNKFTVCDDVAQVETTKGDIFYISLEAMEYIKAYTWSLHTRGYPVAHIKGKRVFLHNFLMSPLKGFVVDHIDGNPKNNTYNNLRLVTPEDNMLNKKTYKNSKIFRGVTYSKNREKYMVRIQVHNKAKFLGYFDDLEEAIQVRTLAEKEMFGELRRCEDVK